MKYTRGQLIKEIDKLVSMRVRYGNATRDKQGTFWCVCVSCVRKLPLKMIDCGHYIQRGCLPLRFDMRNVHCECQKCNRFSADHLVGYSKWMVAKYGKSIIDKLWSIKENYRDGKIKPYSMVDLRSIYNQNLIEVRKIEKKWNIKLIPANRKLL